MNPLFNNQINYQNTWYNANYFNQQNYVSYQSQMQAYQNISGCGLIFKFKVISYFSLDKRFAELTCILIFCGCGVYTY